MQPYTIGLVGGSRRIRTSEALRLGTLAVCWFQPLTHTSVFWMQSYNGGMKSFCVAKKKCTKIYFFLLTTRENVCYAKRSRTFFVPLRQKVIIRHRTMSIQLMNIANTWRRSFLSSGESSYVHTFGYAFHSFHKGSFRRHCQCCLSPTV